MWYVGKLIPRLYFERQIMCNVFSMIHFSFMRDFGIMIRLVFKKWNDFKFRHNSKVIIILWWQKNDSISYMLYKKNIKIPCLLNSIRVLCNLLFSFCSWLGFYLQMNCRFLSLFIVFLTYCILCIDSVINNTLINKILVEFFFGF